MATTVGTGCDSATRTRPQETARPAGAPNVRIEGIAAGLHVLIHLDPTQDENLFTAHARDLGFTAQPLGRYRERPGPPGLVLGYGALTPERIRAAAAHLGVQLRLLGAAHVDV